MTSGGRARVRYVIAAAGEMADGAELDTTAPTPGGPAPTGADAALLGVLLAPADLTWTSSRRAGGDG